MDSLELIENPSSIDVIKISRDLKCSERWVWEAKKRLEEQKEKVQKRFSLLKEMYSDLKFYSSLFLEFAEKPRQLKVEEMRRINSIEKKFEVVEHEIKYLEEG